MNLMTPGLFILAALAPFVKRVDGYNNGPLSYPVAERFLPCICTLELDPVCGSDGNDYSNRCLLRCASDDNIAHGRDPIRIASYGLCPRRPCCCPKIYFPVCGTNKQTYANDCLRRCENSRRAKYKIPPVFLAYYGICGKAPYVCPRSIIPVCGTDGKTYRNVCILYFSSRNVEAQGQKPIRVASVGPCKKENCNCPVRKKKLCGGDGATYPNRCEFDCQNRRRAQLGQNLLAFQYPGKCIECVCPAVHDPVCGSDGTTYPNGCQLDCLNKKRKRLCLPKLTVRHKGKCGCGCTREYKPVCASDHRTKANICVFKCENQRRLEKKLHILKILYPGECRPCDCRYCSAKKKPVCGSDNKVYWNICRFDCNNDCRASHGLSPIQLVKC